MSGSSCGLSPTGGRSWRQSRTISPASPTTRLPMSVHRADVPDDASATTQEITGGTVTVALRRLSRRADESIRPAQLADLRRRQPPWSSSPTRLTKLWIDANFLPASVHAQAGANQPTPIIGDFVRIAKNYNTGGIFGLFGELGADPGPVEHGRDRR